MKIFPFFFLALASSLASSQPTAWEKPFIQGIDSDFPSLLAFAAASNNAESRSSLASTRLRIISAQMPVSDRRCRTTPSPAYVLPGDDGAPVLTVCMRNYGFLESLLELKALALFIFGNKTNSINGYTREIIEEKYFQYLAKRIDDDKPYCEAKTYLFYALTSEDPDSCAARYASDAEKQLEWLKTAFEGGQSEYNKNYLHNMGRAPSPGEYEKYRDFIWNTYRNWSYRAVILHELGHIVNGDLDGETGSSSIEERADDFAMNTTAAYLPHRDVPVIVLGEALLFMGRIRGGLLTKFSVQRDARLTKALGRINEYQIVIESEHGKGLIYSPFFNALSLKGDVTYARNLHETFEYKSNPQSALTIFSYPRSGPCQFYWEVRPLHYDFKNNPGELI